MAGEAVIEVTESVDVPSTPADGGGSAQVITLCNGEIEPPLVPPTRSETKLAQRPNGIKPQERADRRGGGGDGGEPGFLSNLAAYGRGVGKGIWGGIKATGHAMRHPIDTALGAAEGVGEAAAWVYLMGTNEKFADAQVAEGVRAMTVAGPEGVMEALGEVGGNAIAAKGIGEARNSKRPGRLGNARTQEHVAQVADEMESRGWTITHGGGRSPEEFLPGPGGGRRGSSYPDITATKNGNTLRVNTVDTYADGVTMTRREATNAARIRAQTGDHVLTIPKPK